MMFMMIVMIVMDMDLMIIKVKMIYNEGTYTRSTWWSWS